jgi:hypothetical protein
MMRRMDYTILNSHVKNLRDIYRVLLCRLKLLGYAGTHAMQQIADMFDISIEQ